MTFQVGKLHVEVGGLWRKTWLGWLPDGLHVWWGNRGVHLFWSYSPHMRRVTFERHNYAPTA